MDEFDRPGYYAIIPANVRYDDNIPANAKLLYGEISALIGVEGFCYAANAYFMRIYGWSDPTVTRLITNLEKAGYIKRELERDATGQVTKRKIYLTVSMPQIQPPINFDTTSHQYCGEGTIKNDGYTNTSNTVSIEPAPKRPKSVPLSDTEMDGLFVDWIKGTADEDWTPEAKNALYLALKGFYAPRENKKQEPAHTTAGFTALGNRLKGYSGGNPAAMVEMLEQATISGWKSVYEPKNSRKSTPPTRKEVDKKWI